MVPDGTKQDHHSVGEVLVHKEIDVAIETSSKIDVAMKANVRGEGDKKPEENTNE